ncbi:MAG: alpha/beta hydrolase [Thermoguttaceae bacterium]|jgi:acetyl esterase
MALDPQVQTFLEELQRLGAAPFHKLSPTEARKVAVNGAKVLEPPQPVAKIENRRVPGHGGWIPIRIYTPEGSTPLPMFVYYHGGGWVVGDVETHESLCTAIANAAGCIVVSVDYRLAPEHKFPAAVDDAYAAARWVADNAASFGGDPERMAVGGDSAGGNLAAVVALMARDRGMFQLAFQVLIYPVTDHNFNTPSYLENAEGYLLSREDMRWFWDHYLAHTDDGDHPYASPLRACDLSRLPPALVITAEYDPLRDEGEAYAARLRNAGVAVKLSRYQGLIHAFIRHTERFDKAREAIGEVADALKRAFASQPVR